MDIGSIVFKYKNIDIVLSYKAPKTYRFNVFINKILIGEIKWEYFYKKYGLFRIKNVEITDEDWEFIKFCMDKLNRQFYGDKSWI